MQISYHFRDCKALLVMSLSLTQVSGAIASVQTFTFTLHSLLLFRLRFLCVCQTQAEALCSYVVCLSIRSFVGLLPNVCTLDFEKERTDFDADWHKIVCLSHIVVSLRRLQVSA